MLEASIWEGEGVDQGLARMQPAEALTLWTKPRLCGDTSSPKKPREVVYHKAMKSVIRWRCFNGEFQGGGPTGCQKVRIHNNLRARIALLCVVSELSRQSELGLYIVIMKRQDAPRRRTVEFKDAYLLSPRVRSASSAWCKMHIKKNALKCLGVQKTSSRALFDRNKFINYNHPLTWTT